MEGAKVTLTWQDDSPGFLHDKFKKRWMCSVQEKDRIYNDSIAALVSMQRTHWRLISLSITFTIEAKDPYNIYLYYNNRFMLRYKCLIYFFFFKRKHKDNVCNETSWNSIVGLVCIRIVKRKNTNTTKIWPITRLIRINQSEGASCCAYNGSVPSYRWVVHLYARVRACACMCVRVGSCCSSGAQPWVFQCKSVAEAFQWQETIKDQ